MMIDYLEIRSGETRHLLGIIDDFQSIIWKTEYYGVGEFEIYTVANAKTLSLLQLNNLVTRRNDVNCGIINNIEVTDSLQSGKMIVAKGQFAKSILNRRIIYKFVNTYSVTAQILSGNVAEACWNLINNNCGTGAPENRRFPKFGKGQINDLPAIIVDDNGNPAEKQVTYDYLLDYTDAFLQEYKYGSYIYLDDESENFLYIIYSGKDRSRGNQSGNNPLIFSEEFDNLSSSSYLYTDENYKTTAIIGGQGDGLERFVAQKGDSLTGYNRREMFVDANQISKTVKTEDDTEIVYSDAEYSEMLVQEANEKLENNKKVESFSGVLNLSSQRLKFGLTNDYYVGDLITIEDKSIGKSLKARILSATEVQDENGYNIDIEYESDG